MLIDKAVFVPGNPTVVESACDRTSFGAVFEDDGQTGYLYALQFGGDGNPIVDALHVYNVNSTKRREKILSVEITWSDDRTSCQLAINGTMESVFDFATQTGSSRSDFPPPIGSWTRLPWSEDQKYPG